MSSFLKGNKGLHFSKQLQLMTKNMMFHFYGDQELILKYKSIAGNLKKVFHQKEKSIFYVLLKDGFAFQNCLRSSFLE
ncbi:hypothetical protein DOS84_15090 [Flavobacterium aquariorum]|uniref:Uncharacterized protein n=1 Tax=Flavobacterium aquariorum TaxID=2217670 RepID=A0A2W7UGG4_9FLAO|nr:hypothetical protein DOS84_15090 [Flavobacterium aquariorum]